MGCKIAIDDFGTGYSNFAYLIKLHVDYIKIDGSIIKNLTTQQEALWILETIVNFTKRLDIKTIAEFVSSPEILHIVKSLGINESQGFYLGQPAPLGDIKVKSL
jgi:EAL domain-containing protein (putative c-di-GMP-specific phosphodiesterase class I)